MIRTYGGVMLNREEGDQPLDRKTLINTEKKKHIARRAAELINEGDSLIFDAGSTVLQMVPYLARFNNITVMTNSLTIVNQLVEHDSDRVVLMPGALIAEIQPLFMAAWRSRHSAISTSIPCLLALMAWI